MLRLITETNSDFSIGDFLSTVILQFLNQNVRTTECLVLNDMEVPTRIAALQWVLVLHAKRPTQLISHVDELFPALLKTLSDPSEEVCDDVG